MVNSQTNVRPTKMKKSPKAASTWVAQFPTFSIKASGIGRIIRSLPWGGNVELAEPTVRIRRVRPAWVTTLTPFAKAVQTARPFGNPGLFTMFSDVTSRIVVKVGRRVGR